MIDLIESDGTLDMLMNEVIDVKDLSETCSSLIEPSFDSDLLNSSILIPSAKPAKKKKKSYKRPPTNPKYIPAIRIFRRDIRRKYAEMITNVLNSYDLDLHRRFLEEFGHPDLTQVFRSYPPDLFEKLNHKPSIEGFDSLIEGLSRQYMAIPDIVFQMSDVKVCQILNTPGSKIIATSIVRGTMLYSIAPPLSSEKESNNHNNNHDLLQLLDKKIDYCTEGMITITLDEQHRLLNICIEVEKF